MIQLASWVAHLGRSYPWLYKEVTADTWLQPLCVTRFLVLTVQGVWYFYMYTP